MALCCGCTGAIGTPQNDEGAERVDPADPMTAALEPQMIRLTRAQYVNSVRDVFGKQVQVGTQLPFDDHTREFLSTSAAQVGTSDRATEQYKTAALEIAGQLLASADTDPVLAGCPATPTDPCIAEAVKHYGRLLWRRALTEQEVARIAGIPASANDASEMALGMQYVVAALLASPNFLYVPQLALQATNGRRAFSPASLASRLSYWLWNTTPDDELLKAAETGELQTLEGLSAQVDRMLASSKARNLATRFVGESWHVNELTAASKRPEVFAIAWNDELVSAYKQQFALQLEDMTVDQPVDLRQLFRSNEMFVNATLAGVYGVDATSTELQKMAVSSRPGLFTSAPVIAANSPADRTSPTHRGVFVMKRILCEFPPPPPADVNDTLPASGEGTLRERLEQHRTDPECAGCHELFDPLGLTLENFDGIGAYRIEDSGLAVDSSGEYQGVTFQDYQDLASFLYEDPRPMDCMSLQHYRFALARANVDLDQAAVEEVQAAFASSGYRFKALVRAIALSDGFRYVAAGAEGATP